jgi:penicillin amidase
MSEIYGAADVASDKEVLKSFYTNEELRKQYDGMSAKSRAAIDNYVRGVNAWINEATTTNKLPEGYAKMGFSPRVWTVEDTVAISIHLFQLFGRGGAAELRNLAVISYLNTQPGAKGKVLDVMDDLAWQNDPATITTLPPKEDPQLNNPPLKVSFTRANTVKQLADIPALSLFELLPAINMASLAESKRVAEASNTPFRTGSYCVVVGPERSALHAPLLLSGPQMGMRTPSIIHEISIDSPDIKATGMDVPGMPGVVVGMTPNVAWGLTSGVADTEDIFYYKSSGKTAYEYDGKVKQLEAITHTLKVKDQPDQTVEQDRTEFGPVVLTARDHVFVRRSAYWGVEMQSFDKFMDIYAAKTATDVNNAIKDATMNFNFFYAMPTGDFGYRYLGRIPIRASGLDPRLPTPASPDTDWKGFLTSDQMPHIANPKAGILANWNNKPAAWWPNYDTPVWGQIFRNQTLLNQLTKPTLSEQDLEMAAWTIARREENFPYFAPFIQNIKADSSPDVALALTYLKSYDGRLMHGSIAAGIYLAFFDALRSEIFLPTTGNFVSPDLFKQAVQPTYMLRALQKSTKVNYLGSRSAQEVVNAAFAKAVQGLIQAKGSDPTAWAYRANAIPVPGQPPIPYSNRGSYIQIIEMTSHPVGRNVVTPGESEAGEHSLDQVPLARAWLFKTMGWK